MTIGVGTINSGERYILLCSDTRIESEYIRGTLSADGAQKIVQIATNCYACTAFDLNRCQSVLDDLHKIIESGSIPEWESDWSNIVMQAHHPVFEKYLDERLRNYVGTTLADYRKGRDSGLTDAQMTTAIEIIGESKFSAQMVIGAFCRNHPMLFHYDGQHGICQPKEIIGISVIGFEAYNAHEILTDLKQNKETDLPTTFQNTLKAKRAVECKSIGPGTDFVLISRNGSKRLDRARIVEWENKNGTESEFHSHFGTGHLRVE
jgi:hypothetical protein